MNDSSEIGFICQLCGHGCGVQRLPGTDEGPGICGAGFDAKVARSAPHFWEEPCISGTRGSGTIFFSHCALSCVFCQNWPISQENKGYRLASGDLEKLMGHLVSKGVHNINLVNPTHYVPFIAKTLEGYDPGVPVVYNSGGYDSPQAITIMEGKAQVYLPDYKYMDDEAAQKFSDAEHYTQVADQALDMMVKQTGPWQDDDQGIMQRGVMVRHLVLPGHAQDAQRLIRKLHDRYGQDIRLSLMFQYIPMGRAAAYPPINRRLTTLEYQRVLETLDTHPMQGYVQERGAAQEGYTPDFDFQGLEVLQDMPNDSWEYEEHQ